MKLLDKIANTDFVRKAIEERADLKELKKKPTVRVIIGLIVIAISYIIGWPAIIALGAISISCHKPLIVVVGGPLMYGISHLVFFLGVYLAGAQYSKIFLRWASRVIVEKLSKKRSPVQI